MYRFKKIFHALKLQFSSSALQTMSLSIVALSLSACSVKSADLSALVGAPTPSTTVISSGGGSGSNIVQFSILSGNYQTLGLYATAGLQLKTALLKADGVFIIAPTISQVSRPREISFTL